LISDSIIRSSQGRFSFLPPRSTDGLAAFRPVSGRVFPLAISRSSTQGSRGQPGGARSPAHIFGRVAPWAGSFGRTARQRRSRNRDDSEGEPSGKSDKGRRRWRPRCASRLSRPAQIAHFGEWAQSEWQEWGVTNGHRTWCGNATFKKTRLFGCFGSAAPGM